MGHEAELNYNYAKIKYLLPPLLAKGLAGKLAELGAIGLTSGFSTPAAIKPELLSLVSVFFNPFLEKSDIEDSKAGGGAILIPDWGSVFELLNVGTPLVGRLGGVGGK